MWETSAQEERREVDRHEKRPTTSKPQPYPRIRIRVEIENTLHSIATKRSLLSDDSVNSLISERIPNLKIFRNQFLVAETY